MSRGRSGLARPLTLGSVLSDKFCEPMVCRFARLLGISLLFFAFAASAQASQNVARDASEVTLAVNRKGLALVSYRTPSKATTVRLLAWGAINARHPTQAAPQVHCQLDYSGGWKTFRKRVWKRFKNVCGPYTGPELQLLVAACTMPDGSHWALQSWQRRLPGWGASPTAPIQAASDLRLSHWNGQMARLEVWHDWKHEPRFHELFGRLTYRGVPVHSVRKASGGRRGIGYARRVYLDTLNSGYGAGWWRANAILTHRRTGAFCAIFAYNLKDGGDVNKARGERYRLTIPGPGVTPDLHVELEALPDYDASNAAHVQHEQQMNAVLRSLKDKTRFCAGT